MRARSYGSGLHSDAKPASAADNRIPNQLSLCFFDTVSRLIEQRADDSAAIMEGVTISVSVFYREVRWRRCVDATACWMISLAFVMP